MRRIKIYFVLRVLLSAAILATLGAFILWSGAYAKEVFDVLLIAMGLFGIVGNLPYFLLSLRAVVSHTRWEWINLIVSLVGMLLGVSLMLLQRSSAVMPVLLVIYGAVLPVCRMLLVSERAKQLRLELPKIFFGVFVFAVTLTESEDMMFLVLGIICITFAVLYLLGQLLTMRARFSPYEELFKNNDTTPPVA